MHSKHEVPLQHLAGEFGFFREKRVQQGMNLAIASFILGFQLREPSHKRCKRNLAFEKACYPLIAGTPLLLCVTGAVCSTDIIDSARCAVSCDKESGAMFKVQVTAGAKSTARELLRGHRFIIFAAHYFNMELCTNGMIFRLESRSAREKVLGVQNCFSIDNGTTCLWTSPHQIIGPKPRFAYYRGKDCESKGFQNRGLAGTVISEQEIDIPTFQVGILVLFFGCISQRESCFAEASEIAYSQAVNIHKGPQ